MRISLWLLLISNAWSVLIPSGAYHFGNETDRLALLAFKDQSNQQLPGLMTSWNDSSHFCLWGGVTCSHRRQRVIKLKLSSQGLTGSISPSTGNLSFLRYVNLENNTLRGRIPQEIGRLSRLKILYLNNNSFSGPLPVNLSHCSKLEALDVAYNNFTGKIPEEYGSFADINYLSFLQTNLIGRIPNSFGNLTSLQILNLEDNFFDGRIPNSLSQLNRLLFLDVGLNNLSGTVPPLLYNISSLRNIGLVQNQLEGSLPRDIGLNLPALTTFFISLNKFSGPIPVSLFSNCSSIMELDLGSNSFTGDVPVEIGGLKGLKILSLEKNSLGNLDFVTTLSNCSALRYLSIAHNQFRSMLPPSLMNLTISLNVLKIGYNQITGSIPSQVQKYVNLIIFSAESNLLTGGIPSGIGMIQNMQHLSLARNRLSGDIPHSLGNITSLYLTDLSENKLVGEIVTSFGECRYLQVLYLGSNHLTGVVPKQILGMSHQLLFVNLSRNYLSGPLPSEVGALNNLKWLDVSYNKLDGEIPSTLSGCIVLEGLYVQGNRFQGHIPSSFGFMRGLQSIDLSQNNLSGKIPKQLQDLPYLANLNLSFNNFNGEVPIRGAFRNANDISISGNYKLCGGITELHLPNCKIKRSEVKRKPLVFNLLLGLLVPVLMIASVLLVFCWKKKLGSKFSSKHQIANFRRVSYKELRDATNRFSSETLIGVGTFGSVYRGILREDERPIAVKVLNLIVHGASKSFMAECEILRRVRHRNLLKILTVCSSIDFRGNEFKALIFQFMSNGSLENWLHPSSDRAQRPSNFLNTLQRINIAIDVASALDYLHNYSPSPIIHRDIKPSNVLLDDDMVAYLGDFGLAKFLYKSTSNSDNGQTNSITVRGTIGYIPPEYGMGIEATTQGDMYSFGIMLLEMFTGKKPTDEKFTDNLSLHSFCQSNIADRLMEVIDTHLFPEETTNESMVADIEEQICMTNSMKECWKAIIDVGVASSLELASERTDIKDVLLKIHKIKQVIVGIGDGVER